MKMYCLRQRRRTRVRVRLDMSGVNGFPFKFHACRMRQVSVFQSTIDFGKVRVFFICVNVSDKVKVKSQKRGP